jgi:uracil-DNA glycosylase family 4
MNQIENIKGPECNKCEYAVEPIWGIKGPGEPEILIVLQSSDYRALEHPNGYYGALQETLTGGDIDRIISSDWRNVALINSVKCHFKENDQWRDPKLGEYRNCFPILREQVERLDPSLIVCCGQWAIKGMFGEDNYDSYKSDIYSINYIQQNNTIFAITTHPRRFTIPVKKELTDTISQFRNENIEYSEQFEPEFTLLDLDISDIIKNMKNNTYINNRNHHI